MSERELHRVLRLVRITLVVNLVVLAVNCALAYVFVVVVVNEPAEVAGVTPPDDSPRARASDPRPELAAFFDRTTTLLDRMARRHGANPVEFVPTQEEIEAAVETRTLHSDQSQLVLQKLREGYDTFDLSWPIAMPEY